MSDAYFEDADADANSGAYGGNYYQDWQASHAQGTDWYENRTSPGGTVAFGEHSSQHITANHKAFPFWGVLAHIAGWDGVSP
jgi:hypothetical protein